MTQKGNPSRDSSRPRQATIAASRMPAVKSVALYKPRQKRPLTGGLLKQIDLDEAKPRDLRALFALPPDESDVNAHVSNELRKKYDELNKFFELNSSYPNYPERLAKLLTEREFGISSDDPNWWSYFAAYMVLRFVPGFSVRKQNKKKHGGPREWTHVRLARLFADIEYLKKKTRKSVTQICGTLPKRKGYIERWGRFEGRREGLRKAYTHAKKLGGQHFLFQLELCGPDALNSAKRIDPIEAAIERHALKI
jgi:hypothetical protein